MNSFNGSYRIEARIEPTLTTEQRGLLVEVQTLMATGKRDSALAKLKSSPLTAKSPALTFNLGNLYFETGEIEQAAEAYQAALKDFPSFRRAHKNLALAHIRSDELEKALEHLTEAVRLGDSDGSTYGMLGFCRLTREEYASALQSYRLAQVTEPNVAEWKAGIAQCLQVLDAKDEAAALLDEVVRSRPTEASYAVLLANLRLDLGQPDLAAKALELPHRLGNLPPDPTLLLAELHLRADRKPAAEPVIASAFFSEQNPPTEAAILRLITTVSSLADWPLVKDLLGKAKQENPTRPLRLATASYLIASSENPAEGEKQLTALTQEDPTDGQAILALAQHLADTARPDAAALLLERAAADPSVAYEAHIALCRIQVSQSRYADALKSIDSALALNSTETLRTYREALQNALEASQ
ncbi:MAG: tetratricopeptide repeat protein [Akkermansiaceae bacterium]|nr:tetratricopeptide repeat protein [Akkermansiaceae bacterium]MDP4645756.1 tetratricopeptide repeat protein [Akkermansiaceae bacterium]MDP4781513.1 tetratricopeptide repeat protein [Akkermansiaceae bacterium]MDP4845896.1 tetratricopeptide repeat protein [Akkermansiaceae bacterium]MDP4994845.1 tetratricopeptide repeat protein [Akkermansiaceae bacterium]